MYLCWSPSTHVWQVYNISLWIFLPYYSLHYRCFHWGTATGTSNDFILWLFPVNHVFCVSILSQYVSVNMQTWKGRQLHWKNRRLWIYEPKGNPTHPFFCWGLHVSLNGSLKPREISIWNPCDGHRLPHESGPVVWYLQNIQLAGFRFGTNLKPQH